MNFRNTMFPVVLIFNLLFVLASCGGKTNSTSESKTSNQSTPKQNPSGPTSSLNPTDNKASSSQTFLLNTNSTATFSPTSYKGTYGGCLKGYVIDFLDGDPNSSFSSRRRLFFRFTGDPQVNRQYLLSLNGNSSGANIDNILFDTGSMLNVTATTYDYDSLNSVDLTFQNVSSTNITFTFSINYMNGKVLSGKVNMPVAQPTSCIK